MANSVLKRSCFFRISADVRLAMLLLIFFGFYLTSCFDEMDDVSVDYESMKSRYEELETWRQYYVSCGKDFVELNQKYKNKRLELLPLSYTQAISNYQNCISDSLARYERLRVRYNYLMEREGSRMQENVVEKDRIPEIVEPLEGERL